MSTVVLSVVSREWRNDRPFLGGVLLMVAGIIVGWVPLQFTFELILIGGSYTAIGMVFAVLIFLSGVFALLRPDLSTIVGVAGIAFSILSIAGALGGLLVGLLVGIIGGNLCMAWESPSSAQGVVPSDEGQQSTSDEEQMEYSWQEETT